MNGGIYDPILGRFLQADPFIQAPTNGQSYNRYSYVLNNPLSYTDPSGYFFSGLKKFVKKYWKPIVAIIVTVVSYGYLSEPAAAWAVASGYSATTGAVAAGAMAGAAGGFVGGALQTGSLSGALRGAFTGAIAGAAGGYANFGAVGGIGDAAMRVGVSALGGCAAGKASGVSCSQGAKLAALAQALKVGLDTLTGDNSSYKTSKGEAVVKPGGQLKVNMIKNRKAVDWINKDVTNTGTGVTINDPDFIQLVGMPVSEAKKWLISNGHTNVVLHGAASSISEASSAMRWSSENIGGFRSSSLMHDGGVGIIERAFGMENTWYGTAFTIGSIPPAFIAQYAALGVGNEYYYSKNLRRNY